jgi:hypothetical protein
MGKKERKIFLCLLKPLFQHSNIPSFHILFSKGGDYENDT